jgi:hypothetical protein
MSSFKKLIDLSNRLNQKAMVAVGLAISSGLASAQVAAAPTLDSVLDTFMTQIISGLGTTFAKVGPLLALVFGVSFAWKWVKKGSSS